MATLAEFRLQNPAYNSVPDVKLADALYSKFYSSMPKMDFYKQIGLGAEGMIPGAENVITQPTPEVSTKDRIMGAIETPAALAGAVGSGITAPVAGLVGTLGSGKYGTPEGIQAGEQAAQWARSQFYQPRTQTARQALGAVSSAMEPLVGALPPTLGSLGSTGNAMLPAAMAQAGVASRPAFNAMANLAAREQPAMQGMGAANTAAQAMREERLQRLNIPSTLGERTQDVTQQAFESTVRRGGIAGVDEEVKKKLAGQLQDFGETQKQAIVNNFERMTQETGAEVADPTMVRRVGQIVDKALNEEYTKKFDAYKDLYNKADTAGETLQEVSYQALDDYISKQTPTMRKTLDPILNSVSESLKRSDLERSKILEAKRLGKPIGDIKDKDVPLSGNVSIRELEDIYQQIGKTKNSPNAGELKKIITEMGEGKGGEFYQAARKARRDLAKQFEDVSRVDKLLGTKAGYKDRRVALDNVYNHVVLDGSLEEMRTVTTLLKKSGPAGRQAYAELQGQTIQQMKDLLVGSAGDELAFRRFNTLVNQLDVEEKLAYMFGKTGRDQIIDLRDAIKDVAVKRPGAVNYSGSGSAVTRGLEVLNKIRFPGAQTLATMARTREVTGKVTQALEQPNKLAPVQQNQNALSP